MELRGGAASGVIPGRDDPDITGGVVCGGVGWLCQIDGVLRMRRRRRAIRLNTGVSSIVLYTFCFERVNIP